MYWTTALTVMSLRVYVGIVSQPLSQPAVTLPDCTKCRSGSHTMAVTAVSALAMRYEYVKLGSASSWSSCVRVVGCTTIQSERCVPECK